MFLGNAGNHLPDYTMSQLRRSQSNMYSVWADLFRKVRDAAAGFGTGSFASRIIVVCLSLDISSPSPGHSDHLRASKTHIAVTVEISKEHPSEFRNISDKLFMKSETSLPYSKPPATEHNRKPDEPSPHYYILLSLLIADFLSLTARSEPPKHILFFGSFNWNLLHISQSSYVFYIS
jgi:hypothetical protein